MWNRTTILFLFIISILLISACDRKPTGIETDDLKVREPITNNGSELDMQDLPKLFHYEAVTQSLFSPVVNPDTIAENLKHESVLGFTYIRFNERLWHPEFMDRDDLLVLHLPDDIYLQVTVLRVQQPLGEITTVTAQFNDSLTGTVTLNHENGRTIGDIDITSENRKFQIRYDSNVNLHYLMEVDPSNLDNLPGAEPLQMDDT